MAIRCRGLAERIAKSYGIDRREAESIVTTIAKRHAEIAGNGELGMRQEALRAELLKPFAAKKEAALQNKLMETASVARALEQHDKALVFMEAGLKPAEALNALMYGGIRNGVAGLGDSVARHRQALEKLLVGDLGRVLSGPDFEALQANLRWANMPAGLPKTEAARAAVDAFNRDMLAEFFEIRPGGKSTAENPVSGNRQAYNVARELAKIGEGINARFRAAGVMVRDLEAYAPQLHDPAKILGAGRNEWVGFMADRVLDRSNPAYSMHTDASLREMLGVTYDEIVQGSRTGTGRVMAGATPEGIAAHRALHFKPDAATWLAYHERFGRTSNVFNAWLDKVRYDIRHLSVTEVLGPKYEQTVHTLVESLSSSILRGEASVDVLSNLPRTAPGPDVLTRKDYRKFLDARDTMPEAEAKALEQRFLGQVRMAATDDLRKQWMSGGSIRTALREVTGETFVAINPSMAKYSTITRGIAQITMLSRAMFTAIAGDLPTAVLSARLAGVENPYGKILSDWASRQGRAELRRSSKLLSSIHENFLGGLYSRVDSAEPGAMSGLLQNFYRLNGLTPWTDSMREAVVMTHAEHLAEFAGKTFKELPKELADNLAFHGVKPQTWDVMSKTAMAEQGGRKFLFPEVAGHARNGDIEALLSNSVRNWGEMAQAQRDVLVNATRQNMELELAKYFTGELETSILHSTDRVRAMTLRGTQPGTVMGELARFVMQFKQFPLAHLYYTFGRLAPKPGDGFWSGFKSMMLTERGMVLPKMMAEMTMLGYVATALSDMSQGWYPKNPFDGNLATTARVFGAAMLKGGSLGIYGDFLFGLRTKYGGDLATQLAGPVVSGPLGTAYNMFQAARDGDMKSAAVLRELWRSTPYVNLPYVKPVLDMAFMNSLMEHMSPGTLRRAEQRRRQQYGQRSWERDLGGF